MNTYTRTTYDTDVVMKELFTTLASDMKCCTGFQGNMAYTEDAITSRSRSLLLPDNIDAYTYKWCAQLSGFLKRYTFRDDPITTTQREEVTNDKFINLQEGLAKIYWRQRSLRLHEVLRRARTHTRRILSGFSPENLHEYGQFGTKATVGCPASQAYIDEKLLAKPITGSILHSRWFTNDYLVGDPLLTSIIARSKGVKIVEELSQVNVPKKYDIDRGINPNTLLGSLHSSALGRIIVKALLKEGLDIRRLQSRHERLIRTASIASKERRKYYIPFVTADLTNASHSFLSHHLNALLPREWYNACMTGVIRNVEVGSLRMRLESIMTMGIGFTFPMQTLLFYCLLLAIRDLLGTYGLISVYGDDLIYPRKMHPYVVAILSEMGFVLNLDKTFVSSPFRESCGSDWYKGVNVRPFSPEGQSQLLGVASYCAFCYKLINGLLLRWHEEEIPRSLTLLKNHICEAKQFLFYVPMHYPDTSGIKVKNPVWYQEDPASQYEFPSVPSSPQNGENTLWTRIYSCIRAKPRRRFVTHYSPYYWDWLRSRGQSPTDEVELGKPIMSTPTLTWTKRKHDTSKVKCHDGKQRRRKHAYVSRKESGDVAQYEIFIVAVCDPHTEEMGMP